MLLLCFFTINLIGMGNTSHIHTFDLISRIKLDSRIKSGYVFVDKDENIHILTTNLYSIRSYDINGNTEWIVPGYSFFAPFELVPEYHSDYTLLYMLQNLNLLKISTVNLKTGRLIDSLTIKNVRDKLSPIGGIGNNYFIGTFRKDSPIDTPRMEIFKIDDHGKFVKRMSLSGSFYIRKSLVLEDNLAILGMWAPLNGENPVRFGISDFHVGVAMVSLLDGVLLNRFIIPYGIFARSNVVFTKMGDTIFVTYRGNYRNVPSYSGIYKLKIPELREIDHLEILGNLFFTDKIINGRIIAGVDERTLKLYLIDVSKMEIVKIMDLKKHIKIIKPLGKPYLKVQNGVLLKVVDVDNDNNQDIIVKIEERISHIDPRWNEVCTNFGENFAYSFGLLIMGPDFDKVYSTFFGNFFNSAVTFVDSKKLMIIFTQSPPSSILIYRVH